MRKLEKTAQGYFDKGLAESTKKSYSSARNQYLAFCTESALDPFPVNEHKLSLFVSYAAQSGLKYQIIKYYLPGLRYTQISLNISVQLRHVTSMNLTVFSLNYDLTVEALKRSAHSS